MGMISAIDDYLRGKAPKIGLSWPESFFAFSP